MFFRRRCYVVVFYANVAKYDLKENEVKIIMGVKEKILKNYGVDYAIKKQFFKYLGKVRIKGDESGQILGVSIIVNGATEFMHELLIAVKSNLIILEFQKMIFAHPKVVSL